MATESADGSEVSVTLPPSLQEWLDERAEALGVERGEVLVQLASAYRAAAELDDDPVGALLDDALEGRIAGSLDGRIDDRIADHGAGGVDEAAFDALRDRVDALESTHEEDVEDVRNRVLQLRGALRDRAEADHGHEELRERADSLSSHLEDVGSDVAHLSERVDRRDDRLGEVESKLDRLARVVLSMRDGGADRADDEVLEHIRTAANRSRVGVAHCEDCGRALRIALLTRPACPHCEAEFRDLEDPSSRLGRWLDPWRPKLVGARPPALESADE